MTTATATATDVTVARHATTGGFGIGIVRVARSGNFAVVRYNADGAYVTIDYRPTEAAARELANVEWLTDMGRGPAMIACGAPAI